MSACSSSTDSSVTPMEGYLGESSILRPYFNLKDSLPYVNAKSIQIKLEEYQITKLALEKIYTYLGTSFGNGDMASGRRLFIKLVKSEEIWVERIGLDKQRARDKFYIICDKVLGEGTNNTLHLGFSRKGTARAITEKKVSVNDFNSMRLIQEFNEAIKDDPLRFAISRLKGSEEGLQVSELGGENLLELKINKLSQKERFQIHKSSIAGLACIHSHGFVHRDLKSNNEVVVRNEEGKVIGAKIIDFDTLEKINKRAFAEVTYQDYRSLDILKICMNHHNPVQRRITTHPGDDLWAAMITICKLEKKVDKDKRFISGGFMKRFSEYQKACKPDNDQDEQLRYAGQYLFLMSLKSNLFEDIKSKSILDPLIREMAFKDVRKADSMKAEELLEWMSSIEEGISG
jgi:serine/threonine protein kinase